jgi:hypothetical protein
MRAPITALAFGPVAPIGVLTNLVRDPADWGVRAGSRGRAHRLVDHATAGAAVRRGLSGLGLAVIDSVARLAVTAWWLGHSLRRRSVMAGRIAFVVTILCWTSVAAGVALSLDACRCLTVHSLDVGWWWRPAATPITGAGFQHSSRDRRFRRMPGSL